MQVGSHYKLGNFKLSIEDQSQPIGQGGFGAIFVADLVNAPDNSPASKLKVVALKVGKKVGDCSALRSKSIPKNDYLAKCFDAGFATNLPTIDGKSVGSSYAIMELVKGEDGNKWLEALRNTVDHNVYLDKGLSFAKQSLFGLAYLDYDEKKGIAVTDFKPENTMVSDDGQDVPHVKLIDLDEVPEATGANSRKESVSSVKYRDSSLDKHQYFACTPKSTSDDTCKDPYATGVFSAGIMILCDICLAKIGFCWLNIVHDNMLHDSIQQRKTYLMGGEEEVREDLKEKLKGSPCEGKSEDVADLLMHMLRSPETRQRPIELAKAKLFQNIGPQLPEDLVYLFPNRI